MRSLEKVDSFIDGLDSDHVELNEVQGLINGLKMNNLGDMVGLVTSKHKKRSLKWKYWDWGCYLLTGLLL